MSRAHSSLRTLAAAKLQAEQDSTATGKSSKKENSRIIPMKNSDQGSGIQ
jgi:hypothetical protein